MFRAHRSAAFLCAAALAASLAPTTALADTPDALKSQIDQAQTRLNSLYADAESASSDLNKTLDDLAFTETSIEETGEEIEQKQVELDGAQAALRETMNAQYKSGSTSLLSILLSSSTVEDFVSRIYYANKVSSTYNDQIHEVRDLQNDLEQKRSSLEEQQASLVQLRDEQVARKSQLEAKAAEVESYVSGLSSELQSALSSQATARAEAARAQAASTLEAAGGSASTGVVDAPTTTTTTAPAPQQQSTQHASNQDQGSQQTSQPQEQQAQEQAPEPTPQEPEPEQTDASAGTTTEEAPAATGVSNMDARTAVVNYVLAQIGKPYVWATHGPDSYDCSGLTGAAYESIGYFVGYSDSYQEQYCNKPASEAVYGDIVWRPGHVGICIGGGVTVEAHNPANGIGYGSVDNFVRSGSPLG